MLDRKFFDQVRAHIANEPSAGLNGQSGKLYQEFAKLGRNSVEFRKTVPENCRRIIRRAIQKAYNLPWTPNDEHAFHMMRRLRSHAHEISFDPVWRDRLSSFSCYVASTAPN